MQSGKDHISMLRPIDRWFIEEILPHEPAFLARARRIMCDEEEARDVVQETCLRLYAIEGWPAIKAPRSYAMRMVHNIAIERLRRARIISFQSLQEIDAVEIADDRPDAFRIASGRDQLSHVAAALDTLPENCRLVVMRTRVGNETPRQMALAMGISLSTLEKRLSRGLQLLVKAMECLSEHETRAPACPERETSAKELRHTP